MSETTAEFNLKAQKRSDVYMIDPELLVILGVDEDCSPTDPLYDERVNLPLDERLVESIFSSRWIETVEAVMRDGRPVVTQGRSRVRCTRVVNDRLRAQDGELLSVPVRIVSGKGVDPKEFAERLATISLIENAVRRDDPPVTLARKIERLRDVRGWKLEKIAETLQITPQSVRNSLALLKLDAGVAAQVDAGEVGATVGYELAKLAPDQQAKALAELVSSRGGAANVRKADAQVAVTNLRALPAPAPSNGNGAPAATPATPAASTAKGKSKGKSKAAAATPTTRYVAPGARDFAALLRGLDEGTLDDDSLSEDVWMMLRLSSGDLSAEVSDWAAKRLPEDVWAMIRWMRGELSAGRIAGLSQALKIMGRNVG